MYTLAQRRGNVFGFWSNVFEPGATLKRCSTTFSVLKVSKIQKRKKERKRERERERERERTCVMMLEKVMKVMEFLWWCAEERSTRIILG